MTVTSSGGPPLLAIEGRIARIRLNRPERHNRFEAPDIAALDAILDRIGSAPGVRAAIVTAEGPSFSAGFDIGGLGTDEAERQTLAFGALCDRLEALSVPTVCAVNGGVYGGGTDFALACDLRIGVRHARMMMPPTRLGLEYFHGGLRRYVEQLGASAAKRLILTAETIEADEMLRCGFLHAVVDAGELRHRVEALAASCAMGAPGATRGLKASLNAIAQGRADAAAIQARFVSALASPNAQEGVRAWKARRPPVFVDD